MRERIVHVSRSTEVAFTKEDKEYPRQNQLTRCPRHDERDVVGLGSILAVFLHSLHYGRENFLSRIVEAPLHDLLDRLLPQLLSCLIHRFADAVCKKHKDISRRKTYLPLVIRDRLLHDAEDNPAFRKPLDPTCPAKEERRIVART